MLHIRVTAIAPRPRLKLGQAVAVQSAGGATRVRSHHAIVLARVKGKRFAPR